MPAIPSIPFIETTLAANTGIDSVSHLVQLAIAPVFLIAGIGALLNVITSRLSRVIDRSRVIETTHEQMPPDVRERALAELPALSARMTLSHYAIYCCVASALCVCLVVGVLFVASFAGVEIGLAIAALFILAMGLIVVGLVLFLQETRIAIRSVRVRIDLAVNLAEDRADDRAGPRLS
ncbi:DUF2721 domain-containing protein [Pacificimonas sp. ICDLI1SI03]